MTKPSTANGGFPSVVVTAVTATTSIAPDIEIYRFDINEDWRAGVRVMRRMLVN